MADARPLTIIGLCEDYPEESRTLESAERDLALLQSMGVRHLRVALGWDGIEAKLRLRPTQTVLIELAPSR